MLPEERSLPQAANATACVVADVAQLAEGFAEGWHGARGRGSGRACSAGDLRSDFSQPGAVHTAELFL